MLRLTINEHIKRIIQETLNQRYENELPRNDGIFRFHHGGQHASRVGGIYIPVLANLYLLFDDADMQNLNEKDLFWSRIFGVNHDGKRTHDGEDTDETPSAEAAYEYGIQHGAHPVLAEKLKYALLNKDGPRPHSDSHQKLIHDADCLDVKRVRRIFRGEELDFYQQIAHENPEALYAMSLIICEIRGLLHLHGDSCDDYDIEKKLMYQPAEVCFEKIEADVLHDPRFKILRLFYGKGELQDKEILREKWQAYFNDIHQPSGFDLHTQVDEVTEEKLMRAMHQHHLYLRSITGPLSMSRAKPEKKKELAAELEFRKLLRRKGVLTLALYTEKQGNVNRSCTLAGFGSQSYGEVGLFMAFNREDFHAVYMVNAATGCGKKRTVKNAQSPSEIEKNRVSLILRQQLGGAEDDGHRQFSELTADINEENVKAIYFIRSKLAHMQLKKNEAEILLNAVYLQKIYQRSAAGVFLKLFEYSPEYHTVTEFKCDEEKLLALWRGFLSFLSRKKKYPAWIARKDIENYVQYDEEAMREKIENIMDAINLETLTYYCEFIDDPKQYSFHLLTMENDNPLSTFPFHKEGFSGYKNKLIEIAGRLMDETNPDFCNLLILKNIFLIVKANRTVFSKEDLQKVKINLSKATPLVLRHAVGIVALGDSSLATLRELLYDIQSLAGLQYCEEELNLLLERLINLSFEHALNSVRLIALFKHFEFIFSQKQMDEVVDRCRETFSSIFPDSKIGDISLEDSRSYLMACRDPVVSMMDSAFLRRNFATDLQCLLENIQAIIDKYSELKQESCYVELQAHLYCLEMLLLVPHSRTQNYLSSRSIFSPTPVSLCGENVPSTKIYTS